MAVARRNLNLGGQTSNPFFSDPAALLQALGYSAPVPKAGLLERLGSAFNFLNPAPAVYEFQQTGDPFKTLGRFGSSVGGYLNTALTGTRAAPENTKSFKDVLMKAGMTDPNKGPLGIDPVDVLGFGLDVGLNPMTYATVGSSGALTKAGSVAQKAAFKETLAKGIADGVSSTAAREAALQAGKDAVLALGTKGFQKAGMLRFAGKEVLDLNKLGVLARPAKAFVDPISQGLAPAFKNVKKLFSTGSTPLEMAAKSLNREVTNFAPTMGSMVTNHLAKLAKGLTEEDLNNIVTKVELKKAGQEATINLGEQAQKVYETLLPISTEVSSKYGAQGFGTLGDLNYMLRVATGDNPEAALQKASNFANSYMAPRRLATQSRDVLKFRQLAEAPAPITPAIAPVAPAGYGSATGMLAKDLPAQIDKSTDPSQFTKMLEVDSLTPAQELKYLPSRVDDIALKIKTTIGDQAELDFKTAVNSSGIKTFGELNQFAKNFVGSVAGNAPEVPQGQWEGLFKPVPKPTGFEFASPNIETDLNLDQAIERIRSPRQTWFRDQVATVDAKAGLKPEVSDAIGAWKDGAENTVVSVYREPVDYETLRYTAAQKGKIGDQKAVIPFVVNPQGADTLFEIEVPKATIAEVKQSLLDSGIENATFIETKTGVKAYVFDQGNQLSKGIEDVSTKYNLTAAAYRGQGEFLGSWGTRAEGRRVYDQTISAFENRGQNLSGAFQGNSAGRLAAGDIVKAADRGNLGQIVGLSEDGATATVHFANKATGLEQTVEMPIDQLERKVSTVLPTGERIGTVDQLGMRPVSEALDYNTRQFEDITKRTQRNVNSVTRQGVRQQAFIDANPLVSRFSPEPVTLDQIKKEIRSSATQMVPYRAKLQGIAPADLVITDDIIKATTEDIAKKMKVMGMSDQTVANYLKEVAQKPFRGGLEEVESWSNKYVSDVYARVGRAKKAVSESVPAAIKRYQALQEARTGALKATRERLTQKGVTHFQGTVAQPSLFIVGSATRNELATAGYQYSADVGRLAGTMVEKQLKRDATINFYNEAAKLGQPEEAEGLFRFGDQVSPKQGAMMGDVYETIKDKYFSQDEMDVLNRVYQSFVNPEEVKGLLKGIDKATNIFKKYITLPFPAFHVRNFISNMFNSFFGGGATIADMGAGFKFYNNYVMKRLAGTAAEDLPQVVLYGMKAEDLFQDMLKEGVVGAGYRQMAGESGEAIASGDLLGKARNLPVVKQIADTEAGFFRGAGLVGRTVEDASKTGLYFSKLASGSTAREAADNVRKWLFDYTDLTSFEKNIAKRAVPFFCVPDTSEALTKEGWKTYDQLVKREDVLSYNLEKDLMEWVPLEGMAVFEHDQELYAFENKRYKFLFTDDHKWIVEENKTKVDGRLYGGKRKLVTAKELNTNHKIVVTNSNYEISESELTEKEARLLGWVITDGYSRQKGNHIEAVLYQHPHKFLDEVREVAGGGPRKAHPNGTECISIAQDRIKPLKKYLLDKSLLPGLITRLDRKALEAFVDAVYKADGTIKRNRGNRDSLFVAAQDSWMKEAIQIAYFLLGKRTHLSPRGMYISNRQTLKVEYYLKREHYQGKVWCPSTRNNTWVMRQNGFVTISGNTWMRKNLELQLTEMTHNPGRYSTLFKTADALKHSGVLSQEDIDALPDWMKQGWGMPIGKSGDEASWIAGLGLPIENLSNWDPKALLAGVNPLARIPVELITGRNIYKNRDIATDTSAYDYRNMPQAFKDILGVKTIKSDDGSVRYVMPSDTKYLLSIIPGVSRLLPVTGKISNVFAGEPESALPVTSGISTYRRNIPYETKLRAQELQDLLWKELVSKGMASNYSRSYTPSDVKFSFDALRK